MNNGKICVSVCAETAADMIAKIEQAQEFADIIEVRFDCLRRDQVAILVSGISNLKIRAKLLATFRSSEQGGHTSATFDERNEFWRSANERFWGGDFEEDIIQASSNWPNRIISKHDFEGATPQLSAIYNRMAAADAEIIKLAITANDITDCISLWKLLERANTENKKIIPIAMGDAGKWTRILGLAHGAFMTYASLETGDETASGQVTARDLVEVYRVKEIDRSTRIFGVIGDPVTRSLSPYMHNAAFVDKALNAAFLHLTVKNLDEFITRMVKPDTREIELNFGGFSVTMPHKQTVIPHLDAIDSTAASIGAVNTVKIEDDKLTGYNTDAYGFITPLKAIFGDVRNAHVAVIGAGGAARACVYALKQENADVTVFTRDAAKGESFAAEFGVKLSEISNCSSEISDIDRSFDILINTTPLGMNGPYENDSLFKADDLTSLKLVFDLVTRTTDTPLISEARKAGVPVIGGFEMLLAQGCRQFEIWSEQEAPVELMRDSLTARMSK